MPNEGMPNTDNRNSLHRRLRAVAILRYGAMERLYKKLTPCARHITGQLQRGELSASLRAELEEQLGTEAVRFILGQTDTLVARAA